MMDRLSIEQINILQEKCFNGLAAKAWEMSIILQQLANTMRENERLRQPIDIHNRKTLGTPLGKPYSGFIDLPNKESEHG